MRPHGGCARPGAERRTSSNVRRSGTRPPQTMVLLKVSTKATGTVYPKPMTSKSVLPTTYEIAPSIR
eukprot:scaffold179965_cov25-Tisochrysis_lutea.AAC.3